MKKDKFVAVIAVVLLLMVGLPVSAQEESGEDQLSSGEDQLSDGFKKFDVKEDFTENGFQWFRDAELIAAGNLWGRTVLRNRTFIIGRHVHGPVRAGPYLNKNRVMGKRNAKIASKLKVFFDFVWLKGKFLYLCKK